MVLLTVIGEGMAELNVLTQLLKKGRFKSLRETWCVFPDDCFYLNRNIFLKYLFGVLFDFLLFFIGLGFFCLGGVVHFSLNENGFKKGLCV